MSLIIVLHSNLKECRHVFARFLENVVIADPKFVQYSNSFNQ